eukprot:CAMPEP_0206215936 /NCGR_PEP_ID=MMETSP0047_2-20121206/2456_1 /ASSEMBLY_ACC=CAM_ASM_000192 /TAXON_ID=195065 /ORGANISM="Chroomonas mesostigmatica_cf, Strain CCMP1168" /LENGTH=110 /DNA_ID=CAMNT_0053638255 /DNA_START=131 /DNA_END=463 /DNA_ORIENTATION=-
MAFGDLAVPSTRHCAALNPHEQPMNAHYFTQGFPSPTCVVPQWFAQGHLPAFQGTGSGGSADTDQCMDAHSFDGYPSDDEVGDHYAKHAQWWAAYNQQLAIGAIVPEMGE